MKKKLILMLCFIMCRTLLATNGFALSQDEHTANEVDFKIVIDGKELAFDQPVVTVDGSTYLPIRELFEKLGYDVYWDDVSKMVAISEKQQFIFNDDTSTSREGTLKSGHKYIFRGTDELNNYSIDENYREALEKGYFVKEKIFGVEFQGEETIETIAERIPSLLNPRIDANDAALAIAYDAEIKTLIFGFSYYTEHAGVDSKIIVSCEDGTTFLYRSCLC